MYWSDKTRYSLMTTFNAQLYFQVSTSCDQLNFHTVHWPRLPIALLWLVSNIIYRNIRRSPTCYIEILATLQNTLQKYWLVFNILYSNIFRSPIYFIKISAGLQFTIQKYLLVSNIMSSNICWYLIYYIEILAGLLYNIQKYCRSPAHYTEIWYSIYFTEYLHVSNILYRYI